MPGYVDLHNHILPAIDDGPKTMKEAVLMARALVEAGYDTVVTTPHVVEGRPAPQEILGRLAALQAELDRREIKLKLLPGAELHIEPNLLARLQKGEILTLNATACLLLELPMLQPLPPYTEQLVAALVANNYQPVIPHPERTLVLQRNHRLIYSLHLAGALFQVTWGALSGVLGPAAQKTARAILESNLAHFFATDAHSAASRLLKIEPALARYESIIGAGSAEKMLCSRPRRLLEELPLDLPPAAVPAARPGRDLPFLARLRQYL